MKYPSYIELDSQTAKKITQCEHPKVFQTSTTIIYHGHVPHVSYLILQGRIDLYKKKRLVKSLQANCVVGTYQLFFDEPFKYDAVIAKDSVVCIIDRSSLKNNQIIQQELLTEVS